MLVQLPGEGSAVAGFELGDWQMPFNPDPGFHTDFAQLPDQVPLATAADAALLAGIRMGVASQAEPIRTLFRPGEVRRLSRQHGIELTEDLSPAAAQRRYLAGRLDGLRLPTFAWLAHGVAGK